MDPQPLQSEPTDWLYQSLKKAKNFFAENLFGGALGSCVLTVHHHNKFAVHFSPNRWKDVITGELVHEMTMNPSLFATRGLYGVLANLVHEQVHQWQVEHGAPSRQGYHNKEFADKMEEFGLITSTTGHPGGKRTGQRILHYALRSGAFMTSAKSFVESSYFLPLIGLFAESGKLPELVSDVDNSEIILLAGFEELGDSKNLSYNTSDIESGVNTELEVLLCLKGTGEGETSRTMPITNKKLLDCDVRSVDRSKKKPKSRNKVKFSCPNCGANAWGKPSLKIGCLLCDIPMMISG